MKYIIFFVIACNIILIAQQKAKVKFVVIAHLNSADEIVTIAGNMPQLGNWNADRVALDKINDTTFTKIVEFNLDENIEFKITRGSWDKEAVDSIGTIPPNSILKISSDTTVIVHINYWKDQFHTVPHGQITGTVEYIRDLNSADLEPRDIIIWLPPSYNISSEKRYPVLYLHDGQNLFDPSTSSFGYDWRFDEAADSLIRLNEIDELIMVGIYNTRFRWQEYSPGDTGAYYMEFVVRKLKPLIDSLYRTLPYRENTFVGGSSMGGLISFMLAWEYPEIFSKAICVSPAFKIANVNYVKDVQSYTGIKKQIKFYIDNGEVGLEAELQPGIDQMLNALLSQNYLTGQDYFWFKYSEAQHSERDWSKRVWRMLKFLFDKNLQ